MASPAVTYTFSNSTTADASQINQNFTDLINGMTDGTKDFSISALTCAGNVTFNGNTTIGNASSDDLTITASLASTLNIKTTNSYDIGSTTLGLRALYFGANSQTVNIKGSASMSATWTFTLPTTAGSNLQFLQTNGSGVTSWVTPSLRFGLFAYKTAGVTVTAGTPLELICDTEVTDVGSNHSTSTGRFTATVAGYYWVTTNISYVTGGTAPSLVVSYIQINGTGVQYGTNRLDDLATTKNYTTQSAGLVYLAVNDYVSAWISSTTQNVTTVGTGGTNGVTSLSVAFLGA